MEVDNQRVPSLNRAAVCSLCEALSVKSGSIVRQKSTMIQLAEIQAIGGKESFEAILARCCQDSDVLDACFQALATSYRDLACELNENLPASGIMTVEMVKELAEAVWADKSLAWIMLLPEDGQMVNVSADLTQHFVQSVVDVLSSVLSQNGMEAAR